METMWVEVISLDGDPAVPLEALSYTVWATGRLEVTLADSSVRVFEMLDWADIRVAGDRRSPGV